MNELILTQQREHIFEIVLNRPDKRNAINLEMLQQFDLAVRLAQKAPGVRVVWIRGAGGVFSAGIDVTAFLAIPEQYGPNWQRQMRRITDDFQAVLTRLERLELPTIALLQGHCLGLALELALACDMRLAAAVKWYELEMISQAKAAEIAGLSRAEFIRALERFGVSPFQSSLDDLLEESKVD